MISSRLNLGKFCSCIQDLFIQFSIFHVSVSLPSPPQMTEAEEELWQNWSGSGNALVLEKSREKVRGWDALKCSLTLPHSCFWGDWLSFYVVAYTFGSILNALMYPAWSPDATLERHRFPTGPVAYLQARCECNHILHPEDTDFRWAHLKFSLKCLPLRLKPLLPQCLHCPV